MFMKQAHLRRYSVTLAVSYMEIYKDEVYDLLVTRENVGQVCISHVMRQHDQFSTQAPKLPVRENDAGQVFVANLSRISIASVEEFDALYTYVPS